ncbi:MAG: hypothetical protein Q7U04_13725 [Bacteriovorax sp.]|nr:hypothetical protein [Bacteriovorax sp.]
MLQEIKNKLRGRATIDSNEILIKGFSEVEICKTITQLFKKEYLIGNDMTTIGGEYSYFLNNLSIDGEEYLKTLTKEHENSTLKGWFKRNWYPFLTVIITAGINLYKLISEIFYK